MLTAPELDYAARKIAEAKFTEAPALTQQQFRRSVARVITACAIKQLPDELLATLCYNLYVKKYAAQLSLTEFDLAFELNLTGDLTPKAEHYQVFSAEFMCTVLNTYLLKRRQANATMHRLQSSQPQPMALPPADNSAQLLAQLKQDYQNYHAGTDTTFLQGFTPKLKLQTLQQLYAKQPTEAETEQLHQLAVKNLIRNLSNQRLSLRGQKFGRGIDITNTITRLKQGTNLTPTDRAHLRAELTRLQIIQLFDGGKWEELEGNRNEN